MKTLIALTSALFITSACQKKAEVAVAPSPSLPATKVIDQQSAQDTTTVDDIEKSKEVECED